MNLSAIPGTANTPEAAPAAIDLAYKFSLIDALWQPRVVAEMNDYQFKLARIDGDFIWHQHDGTDEAFIVVRGHLRIDLPDTAVHLRCREHVRRAAGHAPPPQRTGRGLADAGGAARRGEHGRCWRRTHGAQRHLGLAPAGPGAQAGPRSFSGYSARRGGRAGRSDTTGIP